MKTLRSIATFRRWLTALKGERRSLVFVPTMGALHEGHLLLVRQARKLAGSRGRVVVSVFVNPTQFNQKTDLKKYPRRLARDASLCRLAGADVVFAPTALEMYPPDFSTWVEELSVAGPLCGARRPGHFRGVCTIVLKLFNLVQPDVAVFGQKDAQQVLVIQRMVRDLNMPVRMKIVPTVREADGLAMSSRNERLTVAQRKNAAGIFKVLMEAKRQFRRGMRQAGRLRSMIRSRLIQRVGVRVDYVEIVDPETLRPVSRIKKGDLLAVAVFLGRVRLIDNVFL